MRGRSNSRPPPASKPITASVIRRVLKDKVLNRDLNHMPAGPKLTELARICEGWRKRCVMEQDLMPIYRQQAEVRNALKNWQKTLGELRETIVDLSQKADDDQHYVWLERRLTEIDEARQFGALTENARYLDSFSFGWHRWQSYAPALAEDLRNALRPANPKAQLELKPIARFLAALAPLLTGESPTVASVETQLKKMKSQVKVA